MTRAVESGLWKGNAIRTARKGGRCEYWMGAQGRCPNVIQPGDDYFEGEMTDDFKAGGFARQRWCMNHLTPEEARS